MSSGYLLDGNDLSDTYGVEIIRQRGAHDFLERKGETGHDWLDDDGEEEYTDASDIYFEPRDIVLKCLIKSSSRSTLFTKLAALKAVLEGSGLHTLVLPYDATTLNIYMKDGAQFRMKSRTTANFYIGEFTLTLREPNPSRS